MNTLIITVGTRQVGWRSSDGVVRCLGADGSKSIPSHIDELYAELGEERGVHDDGSRCSVQDLAERLFLHCQAESDFSPIVLLLDHDIIENEAKRHLKHIILWGTQQPDSVPWQYRRMDTLWLAELMAGAIQQRYPELTVDVWCPVLDAIDHLAIIEVLEMKLMDHVRSIASEDKAQDLMFLLQNRGSIPAIASALEICAAAIVRQYGVKLLFPEAPQPAYIKSEGGSLSAQFSTFYRSMPLGKYFWPIEKNKIIAAWKQGNFAEAHLWLMSHRDRYKPVCDLAQYLEIAINGDVEQSICQIKHQWINSKAVKKRTSSELHQQWLALADLFITSNRTKASKFALIWERMFLYEIAIERQFYSNAFLGFAQVIEAILTLRYETEDWLGRGYITLPEGILPKEYSPTLWPLMQAWEKRHNSQSTASWMEMLDRVRKIRNKIAHTGKAFQLKELADCLLINLKGEDDVSKILQQMQLLLEKLAIPASSLPDMILLRSLYQWGLKILEE